MTDSNHSDRLTFFSWVNLGLGLLLAARVFQAVASGKPGVWTLIQAAVALFVIGSWFRDWRSSRRPALPESTPEDPSRRNEDGAGDEDEPIRSLVLLLDEPRDVSGRAWIGHLGESLGVDLSSNKPDATTFVLPLPHPMLQSDGDACFMLQIPAGAFWILHLSRPYFEEIEEWAKNMPDRRIREAVVGHRAWISVDLVHWNDGPPERSRIYNVIGKTIAALAGPDARAIVCPELQQANEFDPKLLTTLKSGDPLAIFDGPTFAPVMESRTDDEQMEAAVAEARNRWPEFVSHFQQRDPRSDRPFLVKAPFRSGENTEHMWIVVTSLQGQWIHGTLANQPHHLPDHYEGQDVKVDAAELTDWICVDADVQPLGGWTQKVLNAQIARKRSI